MIDVICNDIEKAVKSGAYISALSLALTLPDLCGKAENPNIRTGKRYKDWYKNYIGKYETYDGNEGLYLCEDVVYDLRNKLLHQGSFECENNAKQKESKYDSFFLYFNPDVHDGGAGYIFREGTTNATKSRRLEINAIELIWKIRCCAMAYYKENKERFDFMNVEVKTSGGGVTSVLL